MSAGQFISNVAIAIVVAVIANLVVRRLEVWAVDQQMQQAVSR